VAAAYKMSVGQGGLHFLCTFLSIFLTGNIGRRTVYLYGLICMTALMFLIGFLSLAPSTNGSIGWAQSAIYLVWFCFYEGTIGPVAYIIVGEASSTRLRGYTVGLARNSYNVAGIINSVASPYVFLLGI